MNTIALFLLAILDIMAEVTQLTYEVGAVIRKYAVPALVAVYVVVEMAVNSLIEYKLLLPNPMKPAIL